MACGVRGPSPPGIWTVPSEAVPPREHREGVLEWTHAAQKVPFWQKGYFGLQPTENEQPQKTSSQDSPFLTKRPNL